MHYHLEDLFSVSVLKDKQVNLGRTFQLSNFWHDLLNPLDVIFCVDQGCISCGTCSYPKLTEDHVLTSAYVKIFRTVTRNAVNKRKKNCS